MSCNGCRALRKGCGDSCVLKPSLQWIVGGHQAQVNATLFAAKFFGRSNLIGFLSAVPDRSKPAMFQSLLFEACGRVVNPVSGAVGLLSTGNWYLCKAAVEAVLSGSSPPPLPASFFTSLINTTPTVPKTDGSIEPPISLVRGIERRRQDKKSIMASSTTQLSSDLGEGSELKILNLFR